MLWHLVIQRVVSNDKSKSDPGLQPIYEHRRLNTSQSAGKQDYGLQHLGNTATFVEDELARARRYNRMGKITYVMATVIFTIILIIIALTEYFRPADKYLEG